MPYKSAAQRRFMHVRHPGIAKKWDQKYGGSIAVGERNPSGESNTGGLPRRKPSGNPRIPSRMPENYEGGPAPTKPVSQDNNNNMRAAMRRLRGHMPGPKSQNTPTRRVTKPSRQIEGVIRKAEAKKAVNEARKSNLTEKQYYAKQQKERRSAALQRRSQRK